MDKLNRVKKWGRNENVKIFSILGTSAWQGVDRELHLPVHLPERKVVHGVHLVLRGSCSLVQG